MTTRRTARREYNVAGLKEKCLGFRALLMSPTGPRVTADEIAAVWPGGARNKRRGLDAWIECYAQLGYLSGRVTALEEREEKAVSQLEMVVRAAASREPISVSLSIGDRMVYPKSAWALSFLDSLDAAITPVLSIQQQLLESDVDEAEALRGQLPQIVAMAWRTWAWVLLSEGVALPFGDEGEIAPPAWTEALLPQDILLIWHAHRTLHYDASVVMSLALPKEPGETSRLSLGGFIAGYGSEHGIAPSVLMRRWSFPEALAAAVASSESHRVAEANAKRRSSAQQ